MKIRFVAAVSLALFCGCSSSSQQPQRRVEIYYPAFRQLPPEPVYNRTAWSQLPQAFPSTSEQKAPYFAQVMFADFPNATLGEAVDAVAQTIGYRAEYPGSAAGKRISLKFSGTLDEILGAVGRQGEVSIEVDHTNRLVRVIDSGVYPRLELPSPASP